MLWHAETPIGICVFCTPSLSLSLRNRFFGMSGKRSRLGCAALNSQLVTLSRVVLDPKYRGARLASLFVRRSCEACRWPWVEAVAEMGRINPFFERAGFKRVGRIETREDRSKRGHEGIYGTNPKTGGKVSLSQETHRKSRFGMPEYFVFDNRGSRNIE